MQKLAIAALLLLCSCATTNPQGATKVVYQDVMVEVQRPCPVKVPVKPTVLERPLPADPGALVDVLVAKLKEWAGEGGYGEQADTALKRCTAK